MVAAVVSRSVAGQANPRPRGIGYVSLPGVAWSRSWDVAGLRGRWEEGLKPYGRGVRTPRRVAGAGNLLRPGTVGARRLMLVGAAVGIALAVGLGWSGDLEGEVVTFESRPDLRPPAVSVEVPANTPRPPYTFVAPWRGEGQAGPMILDGHGEIVWFHPLPAQQEAMDFRVQRYRGRPVLTWWEGFVDEDGYGHGEYVIADRSYREIARLRPADGRLGDFHEFTLTPRGTALITAYRTLTRDLSQIGGSEHATVLESVVQEIDIATGRALLTWRALDHVDLAESHEEVPDGSDEAFDHFHVNSIEVDHDNNLLVSSRHTDTVYKVDRRTGEVIWRLGGQRSDFALGPGARFYAQHDARRQPNGDITLFDNSNPPQVRESSRALRLAVDESTMTVRLKQAVEHPLELSSESQGNMQAKAGGDMVVGWGSEPYVSRFSRTGVTQFSVRFPEDTDVYRAYQFPWNGRATGPPAVSVEVVNGQPVVYASWNGSTEVSKWQVLCGRRPDSLRPVASSPWEGFETAIETDARMPYYAVRALGSSGNRLATSEVVTTRSPHSPDRSQN